MHRRGGRPRITGVRDAFAAIADPTRRRLLTELAAGDRTVSELSVGLAISQPAVSQHLKVLREAGLVLFRSVGRAHRYRLCAEGISGLCAWLVELERRWHARTDPFREDPCGQQGGGPHDEMEHTQAIPARQVS